MTRQLTIRNISICTTAMGVFFISGMFWADMLDPLIFDASGEFRTDGIFDLLSPFLLQVNKTLSSGWLLGIPLFLMGLFGTIAARPRSEINKSLFDRHRMGSAALGVALIAHILVLLFSVQFFFIPADAIIRPMGWAFMMFIISGATFIVVVPSGVMAMIKERPRYLGAFAVFIGLTPIWFSKYLLNIAATINGFHLAD